MEGHRQDEKAEKAPRSKKREWPQERVAQRWALRPLWTPPPPAPGPRKPGDLSSHPASLFLTSLPWPTGSQVCRAGLESVSVSGNLKVLITTNPLNKSKEENTPIENRTKEAKGPQRSTARQLTHENVFLLTCHPGNAIWRRVGNSQ